MGQIERVGSLEIDQDLEFERRQWALQRAGWIVIGLVVLLALTGLLGGGPFSHAEAASGPLTLQYDRFIRERAPSELQLDVDPGAASDSELVLSLNQGFLEKVDVERIVPEPTEMETAADRIVYRFVIPDPEQPATIVFHLDPTEPGQAEGRVGLVDGEEIPFAQFIYP
jgi:hypothetical protein